MKSHNTKNKKRHVALLSSVCILGFLSISDANARRKLITDLPSIEIHYEALEALEYSNKQKVFAPNQTTNIKGNNKKLVWREGLPAIINKNTPKVSAKQKPKTLAAKPPKSNVTPKPSIKPSKTASSTKSKYNIASIKKPLINSNKIANKTPVDKKTYSNISNKTNNSKINQTPQSIPDLPVSLLPKIQENINKKPKLPPIAKTALSSRKAPELPDLPSMPIEPVKREKIKILPSINNPEVRPPELKDPSSKNDKNNIISSPANPSNVFIRKNTPLDLPSPIKPIGNTTTIEDKSKLDLSKKTILPSVPNLPDLPNLEGFPDLPNNNPELPPVSKAIPAIEPTHLGENTLNEIKPIPPLPPMTTLPSLDKVTKSGQENKALEIAKKHSLGLSNNKPTKEAPIINELPPLPTLSNIKPDPLDISLPTKTADLPPIAPMKTEALSIASRVDNTTPNLTVNFSITETEVPLSSQKELKTISDDLLKNKDTGVTIVAYASGNEDMSSMAKRVSLSRALAVRAFLIDLGVDNIRINVQARGNDATNGNKERADIFIK